MKKHSESHFSQSEKEVNIGSNNFYNQQWENSLTEANKKIQPIGVRLGEKYCQTL